MTWPVAAVLIALQTALTLAWYILELKRQRTGWDTLVNSNAECLKELKTTMAAVLKLNANVNRLNRVLELEEAQAVARGELEARDG